MSLALRAAGRGEPPFPPNRREGRSLSPKGSATFAPPNIGGVSEGRGGFAPPNIGGVSEGRGGFAPPNIGGVSEGRGGFAALRIPHASHIINIAKYMKYSIL